MELKLEKKSFQKLLSVAGMFAGKNRTLPITECVKLDIRGNVLTVTSTDGSNAVRSSIVLGEDYGGHTVYCVNYRDLSKYVSLISDSEFGTIFDESRNSVKIVHSKGEVEYPLQKADDFVSIQLGEPKATFSVNGMWLASVLSKSGAYVTDDALRPVVSSFHLYKKGNRMGICMTNTMTLFNDEFDTDSDVEDYSYTVHIASAAPLIKVISNQEEVVVKAYENRLLFKAGDSSIICSCVQGNYPNFRMVIPDTSKMYCMELSRQELVDSLNRCSMVCDATAQKVVLSTEGDRLTIKSSDLTLGKECTEVLNVNSEKDMRIAFNASKLAGVLNCVDTDVVRMYTNGENRPAVFKEEGYDGKVHLIMPMMIQ